MSTIINPNSIPERSRPSPGVRARRKMVKGLAIASAATAVVGLGYNKVKDNNAHNALPACIVPVDEGYGTQDLVDLLNHNGGDVSPIELEKVFIGPRGNKIRNENNTPNYWSGSMGMQPGDRAEFSHVDPNVCRQAAQHIINIAAVGTLPNNR